MAHEQKTLACRVRVRARTTSILRAVDLFYLSRVSHSRFYGASLLPVPLDLSSGSDIISLLLSAPRAAKPSGLYVMNKLYRPISYFLLFSL